MRQSSHGRIRNCFLMTIVVVLALGVAACGRKAAPAYPDGATYPEEYPVE